MSSTTETDCVLRLTVQRTPHFHSFTAELVDRTGNTTPQPVPFRVTKALNCKLRRWMTDFALDGNCLQGSLDVRYNSLYCELRLATLLQHHLGWTNLACEVVFSSGAHLPRRLLGLYYDTDPTVRRLTPVEIVLFDEMLLPSQLPVHVLDRLEDDLYFSVRARVEEATNGYLVSPDDPSRWNDPDFEAQALHHLLRHLKWVACDFTVVYETPPTV